MKRIHIEVSDDGVGFFGTEMTKGSAKGSRSGVGLMNVAQRIRTFGGDGLHIQSPDERGRTSVWFEIPLRRENA